MIFNCREKEEQFFKINKEIEEISNSITKLDMVWKTNLKLHSIKILTIELQKLLKDGYNNFFIFIDIYNSLFSI